MRIGLDGTPLLGRPTGVGRYVSGLLGALVATTGDAARDDVRVTAFTLRGGRGLAAVVPAGAAARPRPAPARLLRLVWSRSELVPVTLLAGRSDVFHGTNFTLPPTGRAGGVVTVHDLAYLHHPDTVARSSAAYRELVPRSIARAAQVVVPSAAVAAELRETYRLAEDRVTVTPLGVDEAWSRATPPGPGDRRRLGLPEDYLVAVGTIEPRKGLPGLLTAYRALLSVRPQAPPLVLVGPEGWGAALELDPFPAGAVRFTGYLADDDLRGTVAGARALVFPSRYEGFGLPPLEALACGVPVIASDLPVTREVLGGAARLTGSAEELVDALVEAVDGTLPGDPGSRRSHASAWTWERCAERTRTAYRRALS
ncbi:glycosyltransferase family 1 protein [Geodermatophilus marinus]|nr:glycosyltransferase family 1 protein [Geodermatophilus sp. LHW52908]